MTLSYTDLKILERALDDAQALVDSLNHDVGYGRDLIRAEQSLKVARHLLFDQRLTETQRRTYEPQQS